MILNNIFESKYSKLVLGLTLLVLGIVILGVPYTKMGFYNDDYIVIFQSKFNSWSELFSILSPFKRLNYSANIGDFYNYSVGYRPFQFLILGFEYFLFKINGYGYLLFNVFFHSLNSVLIFNIFSWFVFVKWAFIGALFFLFQGFLTDWAYFAYSITDISAFFFILLAIVFYKKYLIKNFYEFYVISGVLFLCSLFTKETYVFFPFLLILFLCLFWSDIRLFSLNFFIKLLKKTYLFFVMLFFYFILRIARKFLLGLGCARLVSTSIHLSFKDYIWLLMQYLKNLLGLVFVKTLNPRPIFLIVLPIILFLCFLFLQSKYKKYLFFLIIAVFFVSWPYFLLGTNCRYVYPAISCFILFFILSFVYSIIKFKTCFKVIGTFLLFLIFGFCFGENIKRALYLEQASSICMLSLQKFVNNEVVKSPNDYFVFLSLPHIYLGAVNGMLYGIKFFSNLSYDVKLFNVGCTHWLNDNYLSDNFKKDVKNIDVFIVKGGYRFISKDKKITFCAAQSENFSWGELVVNNRFDKWRVNDISFIVNKEFFKDKGNVRFFYWNTNKLEFRELVKCC